jgi:hypothetical protein
MNLYILKYTHRHGTDIIPCLTHPSSKPPKITSRLLKKLGVLDPELDRDDEWVEWVGPFPVKQLPALTKPK